LTQTFDWKSELLGNVFHTTSGGTPSRKNLSYYRGNIPWVKSGELESNIIYDTEEKITEDAIKSSSAKIFPKGTLLIALYGATIGKLATLGIDAATNQAVCGIFENKEHDLKYLYWYLHYRRPKLVQSGTGGAQPNISQTILKNLEVPLPSKPTQQAIVSKIEELFSELDKGIENLLLAQQQLKTYRQSVLNFSIPASEYATLNAVIDKLDQGWSPRCENEASNDPSEWAVIKTSAVQHGYFVEGENKRLPRTLQPRIQHELIVGDILITRAGPRVRVGVCCLIKNTRPKLINCDKVYRIRANKKIVLPHFIEFLLNTPKYLDEIEKMKTGINDSGVNLTQKSFIQMQIPVPSLQEQKQIIQSVENRLSLADKMEESFNQSLQQAQALRQSILKKAFEGKLV